MGVFRWIAQRGLRVTMALAVATVVYHIANELRVLMGRPLNFHQRLELLAVDVKFSARGKDAPDKWGVAIAALDERSIERFGPPPWSRSVHAKLVDALAKNGAGSVAFDMTFEQPQVDKGQVVLHELVEASGDLTKATSSLDENTVRAEKVKRALEKVKRPPRVRRLAERIDPLIAGDREAKAAVEKFTANMKSRLSDADPDRDFAEAIARSGRVVLGVVSYSKLEAQSLELSEDDLKHSLEIVSSSTITDLVEPAAGGVGNIFDGGEVFETGVYRKYFGVLAPTDELAKATKHFATINASPDDDGVNRRLPLVSTIKGSGVLLPTLALKAVQVATGGDPIDVIAAPSDITPQAVKIGDLTIDTELAGSTTLDWYGRFDGEEMPILSIAELIDGKVDRSQVEGRVIFVAATAIGTHDQRVTPLERAVPGVYVHATLAQNILDGRHLVRPPHAIAIEIAMMLFIGLLAGLLMARLKVIGQVVVAVLLAIAWVACDQLVFFRQGLVVYTVLPVFQIFITLLAVAMWSFFVEQRERRKTKAAFGQYLAPRVMEQVLADPETYLKLGGQRYEATVLFSDIRGFTTISEALTPEELGTLLNKYMTPMTNIVFEFEGTLDKYIGDAVMAFWGAPVEQDNHALLACRASLKMLEVVDKLNEDFAEEGLPHIAIGIGLSSGPMTIGNMGSDEHFAYTALGDRVNLGARLEGQTKEYGVKTMISEATHELVKDEMLCRELGSLRVKGKYEPVRIYELVGLKAENEARVPFVDAFHEGLAAFRAQNWEEATACFTRSRALAGIDGDKASDLYIVWCQEYQEDPPPADWDGVRVATTK